MFNILNNFVQIIKQNDQSPGLLYLAGMPALTRTCSGLLVPAFLLFVLFLAACRTGKTEGQGPTFVIVRHAEKETGKNDPDLSPAGKERAARLDSLLRDMPVQAVYTTDFARTRQTVAGIAERHHVPLMVYDPADPRGLATKWRRKHAQGIIVVAGHSNTVPGLVEALSGKAVPAVADGEYSRLYLIAGRKGKRVYLLHY